MKADRCAVCHKLLSSDSVCSQCQQSSKLPKHTVSRRAVVLGLSGFTIASTGIFASEMSRTTPSRSSDLSKLIPQSRLNITPFTLNKIFGMKWSPNGKYIASAGDNLQVWDVAEGSLFLTCYGHADEVLAVSWSPDSEYIASASFDRTVRVWNAQTGNTILIYQGHSNWVRDVAWSPDGKRIASAGYDKTVQLWDPFTGDKLFTYDGHNDEVTEVIWSLDGTHIASIDLTNTVHIW